MSVLNVIINLLRSIPFLILMIMVTEEELHSAFYVIQPEWLTGDN